METKIEDFFEGRWEMLLCEYYIDGKWELEYQYEDGEYWWEFLPDEVIDSDSSLRFEGRVIEHSRGCNDSKTKFSYCINGAGHTLIIDQSSYLEDGFLDICMEHRYSFEDAESRDDDKRSLYLSLINEPDCPPPYFRYLAVVR